MVRSGIRELFKALLWTVCITERPKNEHGREQLEHNGTHGVVMTGFESALVDDALRGISALSSPLQVRTVSDAKSRSWEGPSLFVCLPNLAYPLFQRVSRQHKA